VFVHFVPKNIIRFSTDLGPETTSHHVALLFAPATQYFPLYAFLTHSLTLICSYSLVENASLQHSLHFINLVHFICDIPLFRRRRG
jgi:acyl-CoA thioesterase